MRIRSGWRKFSRDNQWAPFLRFLSCLEIDFGPDLNYFELTFWVLNKSIKVCLFKLVNIFISTAETTFSPSVFHWCFYQYFCLSMEKFYWTSYRKQK